LACNGLESLLVDEKGGARRSSALPEAGGKLRAPKLGQRKMVEKVVARAGRITS